MATSSPQNGTGTAHYLPATTNPIFPALFAQNSGQGMQIVVDFSNLAACLPPYEKKMNSEDK
jgi:hypothetical protein